MVLNVVAGVDVGMGMCVSVGGTILSRYEHDVSIVDWKAHWELTGSFLGARRSCGYN